MTKALDQLSACLDLIQQIKDALATEETGAALVEVARNACRAEQELARIMRHEEAHAEMQSQILYEKIMQFPLDK